MTTVTILWRHHRHVYLFKHVKHGTQNIQNDCHQWLCDSFRAHQIRFRPGSAPSPARGVYSAPPDPLAGLRRPTSKGDGHLTFVRLRWPHSFLLYHPNQIRSIISISTSRLCIGQLLYHNTVPVTSTIDGYSMTHMQPTTKLYILLLRFLWQNKLSHTLAQVVDIIAICNSCFKLQAK